MSSSPNQPKPLDRGHLRAPSNIIIRCIYISQSTPPKTGQYALPQHPETPRSCPRNPNLRRWRREGRRRRRGRRLLRRRHRRRRRRGVCRLGGRVCGVRDIRGFLGGILRGVWRGHYKHNQRGAVVETEATKEGEGWGRGMEGLWWRYGARISLPLL